MIGIDLSFEMVAATEADLVRRAVYNASVLAQDAQHLAFRPGSFDVVTCSQAVGQFPEPSVAAREFRRVMRAGARIGVQRDVGADPRWAFAADELEAFLERLPAPPAPKRSIDVTAVLGEAGFVDVATTSHDRGLPDAAHDRARHRSIATVSCGSIPIGRLRSSKGRVP